MAHNKQVFQETFRDIWRFFDPEDYREKLEAMTESFVVALDHHVDFLIKGYLKATGQEAFQYKPQPCPADYAYIPRRTTKSPILHMEDYLIGNDQLTARYQAFEKKYPMEYFEVRTLQLLIQYYIDGQRNLWEIAHAVMRETGSSSPQQVHDLVQLLVSLGTVEIQKG